jgi:hypothetical protein
VIRMGQQHISHVSCLSLPRLKMINKLPVDAPLELALSKEIAG